MLNPYANASISEESPIPRASRSVGLWIAVIVLALPGLTGLILLGALLVQFGVAEVSQMIRESWSTGSAFVTTLFLVGLISGIGLWRGSRWGWYLALTCCLEQTYWSFRGCLMMWPPTLGHLVFLSAFASMAVYLNWGRARDFCHVYHRRRWLVFLTVFLLAAVLYFVMTWIEPIVTHWRMR